MWHNCVWVWDDRFYFSADATALAFLWFDGIWLIVWRSRWRSRGNCRNLAFKMIDKNSRKQKRDSTILLIEFSSIFTNNIHDKVVWSYEEMNDNSIFSSINKIRSYAILTFFSVISDFKMHEADMCYIPDETLIFGPDSGSRMPWLQ